MGKRRDWWNLTVVRNIIITVLAFAVVGTFAVLALNLSFLSPIAQVVKDFEMTDIYYQILQDTDSGDVSDRVTIVDMSELYSRRDLAEALQEIERHKPKAVGVDVVFEGLKEDCIGDSMIRRVAVSHPNMVFSYKLLDYVDDSTGFVKAVHSFFVSDSICEGFTNMHRNLYGGMKRVMSLGHKYKGEVVPSFVTQVAKAYGAQVLAEERDLNINFTPRRFRIVAPEAINNSSEWIKNRVVLYGAMTDEQDMHYTPIGKMAGVELVAYAIESLLGQSEVRKPHGIVLVLLSFLLVLLTQVLFSVYKTLAKKCRGRLLRFLLTASFVRSLLMFLWMAFWLWVCFILFGLYDISLNLGWALSAMASLGIAEEFYNECLTTNNE